MSRHDTYRTTSRRAREGASVMRARKSAVALSASARSTELNSLFGLSLLLGLILGLAGLLRLISP